MAGQIVDSKPFFVRVRFLKNDVHTGEEHRTVGYRKGEEAEIPRDVADVLASRDMAEILGGASAIKAKERGKQVSEKALQAAQKSRATVAMMEFDSWPPELRAICREHDGAEGEITQLLAEGNSVDDIVRAYSKA